MATSMSDQAEPNGNAPTKADRPNQRALQKQETRRRLLEAATEVFVEQGPTAGSLEEVATRAGVSRPTLIFHFGTRIELMNAVARYHLERYRDREPGYRPGELRPYVEAFLASQADPVVRLIWTLGSLAHPDRMPPEQVEANNASYWQRFGALKERIAAEAGVSREEAHARAVLIAPGLLAVARRAAQDLTTEAEIQEFVETVCQLALAPGSFAAGT